MKYDLNNIVKKFRFQGTIQTIRPYGNGHINDTFLVTVTEERLPDYILQRKNHQVFKNIPGMMENIARVTRHIRTKLILEKVSDPDQRVITHIPSLSGEYFYHDGENFWTLFLFIREGKSFENITKPEQAYLSGKAFGQFQKQLADLPGTPLNETIPDFHNIRYRLENFNNSLKVNFKNRRAEMAEEIEYALGLEQEMSTLYRLQQEKKIPLRITHNDTKINNILFDSNDNILCIIDLDTVMPGLVHFDFGDAIRTAANKAQEDEADLTKTGLNLDIFEGFTRGFLEELKDTLIPLEKDLLPHSAKFMTYIMGLRFLTDYLDGDTYYKIKYPGHNKVRARSQFQFVRDLENSMDRMKQIVQACS